MFFNKLLKRQPVLQRAARQEIQKRSSVPIVVQELCPPVAALVI